MNLTRAQLARMIDHAVLAPDATEADLREGVRVARECDVAGFCVRPSDVNTTADLLAGTDVLVGTVVGFPHGSTSTAAKVAEVRQALLDGARELDMVLHIGRLRDADIDYVREDIFAVVEAAREHAMPADANPTVKVILECAYLDEQQIVAGCRAAMDAGADYVKTSTGFAAHGARVEHVKLMRTTVGDAMGVKAAGGIRTPADAKAMIAAGATRLGTSSTEKILAELDSEG